VPFEQGNKNLLQKAEVGVKITIEEREINYRVANQLTRAMVGSLSSTVRAVHGVGEHCFFPEARFVAGPSHGVDGFVFEKEKMIGRLAGDFTFNKRFLQV
jgi:hypothetical protein